MAWGDMPRLFEFGPFRLDAGERLLFRDGERVELAPKVLDTLILLVENHEHLVTKDELIKKLWPETFVEESNLTFNVSTLRKILGDDRNNGNRFIETVPKRGYRFIAPVRLAESPEVPGHTSKPQSPETAAEEVNRGRWWIAVMAVVAGTLILVYGLTRPVPLPRVSAYPVLTHDGRDKDIHSPLLTDGLRIYFSEYADQGQILASVSTVGGEVAPISTPFSGGFSMEDISSDRRQLLIRRHSSLWRLPVPAGSQQEWQGFPSVDAASWSPDGKTLVFGKGKALYQAKADGSEPHKLTDVPGGVDWPRVSPDGATVRFTVGSLEDNRQSIWEVRADGSHLRALFPNWSAPHCCGNWTPDGKYFFFVVKRSAPPAERGEIWVMHESGSLRGNSRHAPVQITHSSPDFFSPVSSPDGKQLFAFGREQRGELMRYDFRLRDFVRFLDGLSASWVSFSRDGQKIAYEKFPDATLWVSGRDGSSTSQLTFDPMVVDGLSFAPDGKRIAFRGREPAKPFKIRLVPVDGRESQGHELIPGHNQEEGIPTWSPDGSKIAFGDVPRAFGKDDGTHAIRIFDLQTHTLSSLPGSKGLWSARWSPDGRYIAALTISIPEKLEICDFKSGKCRDTGVGPIDNLIWSHDGRYIYFDTPGSVTDNSGIFRVRVSNGTTEKVTGFGNLRRAARSWSGLTPNDEPLILRDIGTSEIYALDVDWP